MTNEQIRARANRVLKDAGVTTAPVSVDAVAKFLGASIVPTDCKDDISGVLIRESGRAPVIGVNSKHSETRQRFTTAHEIGHLVLQHDGSPVHYDRQPMRVNYRDLKSSTASDPAEIEANRFAAELLMPENLLREHVGQDVDLEEDTDTVEALARRFNVSVQAMTIRLSDFRFAVNSPKPPKDTSGKMP